MGPALFEPVGPEPVGTRLPKPGPDRVCPTPPKFNPESPEPVDLLRRPILPCRLVSRASLSNTVSAPEVFCCQANHLDCCWDSETQWIDFLVLFKSQLKWTKNSGCCSSAVSSSKCRLPLTVYVSCQNASMSIYSGEDKTLWKELLPQWSHFSPVTVILRSVVEEILIFFPIQCENEMNYLFINNFMNFFTNCNH